MSILSNGNHKEHNEKPNKYVVAVVLAISLAGIFYVFSRPAGDNIIKGTVIDIQSEQNVTIDVGNKSKLIKEQILSVEVGKGDQQKNVIITNDYRPVAEGDEIFIRGSLFGDSEFSMVDVSRVNALILLMVFFVVLVVAVGGWKGVYSLIGLLFTFAVIFVFLVPQILNGASPVIAGIASAATILIPTLYLSYGFNRKSIAALLGIIFSLIAVGFASSFLVEVLKFTGLSEASMYLDMETATSINLLGLLVAGIIIAAVGVLDDVAVIQSSVVFSLAGANPDFRGFKLFKEAMTVGKDHISAVVNTLVLAYTGASLPLILLLSLQKMPVNYFVSTEMVAEEIVRTLISSSGLLLAVPFTTLIAVFMAGGKSGQNLTI